MTRWKISAIGSTTRHMLHRVVSDWRCAANNWWLVIIKFVVWLAVFVQPRLRAPSSIVPLWARLSLDIKQIVDRVIAPNGTVMNWTYLACRTLLSATVTVFGGICFAAITQSYDNLSRLTSVDYGNGTSITYQYDAAGNITQVKTVGSTVPTCTAINGSSTATVNVATNYSAICVNTSTFVWKLNGTTISACTTATCSVTFTATGPNTLTVAPSTAQNNTAGLAVTVSATPTQTCSLIAGPQSIPASANSQTYTATCSNTSAYVWSLDGTTIPSCTTATCSVSFPANSTAASVNRVVAVAPSGNAASIYRLPVGQAGTVVPVQCASVASGPTAVPAVGGAYTYAASCTGAARYTWTVNGTLNNCTTSTCAITFPSNTSAAAITYSVAFTAFDNTTGFFGAAPLTVTVAAPPLTCSLDFNGDGTVNTTDALLFNRWLLGFRGDALVGGITPYPAGATTAAFAAAVTSRMTLGPVHDFDNDTRVLADTDGLIFLRLTQGLAGTSVTNGALGSGALRNTHELIRMHVNTNCGTAFASASPLLFDDFTGSALNPAIWTEVRGGTGVATVSGGTVTFDALVSANTQGKVAISGSKIVVEGRFTGLGPNRDTTVWLVDAATGDYLFMGDTNYGLFGFYSGGTGQLAMSQSNLGGTTSAFKEYRLTVDGANVLIERGDTLANITQTRTATLPTSVAGKAFYLKISTASPSYSPGTFDWVRVQVF